LRSHGDPGERAFEATRTALRDELGIAIAAGNDEIAEKAEVILTE
jgi:hypothetical protein